MTDRIIKEAIDKHNKYCEQLARDHKHLDNKPADMLGISLNIERELVHWNKAGEETTRKYVGKTIERAKQAIFRTVMYYTTIDWVDGSISAVFDANKYNRDK